MYEGLKHFHLLTIVISVLLLAVRYGLMMMDSPKLQHPFLVRFPHINDSVLLLSGFGLIYLTGFIPFTPSAPWLTEKLTCVMAYIVLGFFSLRLGRTKLLRTLAFFGALGWLGMAAGIAVTKTATFFG
ncbi:hypothetical protein BCU68_15230 [Vibrio sp. 10N.286.49.B3]|uniref:SirB2 family protein n=1 Tax=Vibrio sp. 10N.286.49.B3 TaxID=1880855 RepID=UPI000C8335B4|nr:SirB2 family protein [Vibrio sp. 10N.286.49.B3]PMH41803.1 hypothetical protein BCU68_15230 [Vibrio sp. 10N.286.49.B3]